MATEQQHNGHTSLARVGQEALSRHLDKLRESIPVALDGRDPEGVHDMRTATRRLRTTLQILEETPLCNPGRLRKVRRRLRRLARALGQVRDLDVLLDHSAEQLPTDDAADAGITALREVLESQRKAARGALVHELERPQLEQLLVRIERIARALSHLPDDERTLLVRHFAGSAIWRRYEAILSFERATPQAPPATLHQVRIACKRLRYALELFAEPLGPDTQTLLDTLIEAQDHLGALQDHIAALARLEALPHTEPESLAVATYVATRASERDHLQSSFGPLWDRLTGSPFREKLTTLIAQL